MYEISPLVCSSLSCALGTVCTSATIASPLQSPDSPKNHRPKVEKPKRESLSSQSHGEFKLNFVMSILFLHYHVEHIYIGQCTVFM